MSNGSSKPYVIDYNEEHERLERQARIGKIEDHLNKFSFASDATILDAGCGSGSMTRLLAKAAPDGRVVGVDVSEDRLSYARMRAQQEAIENISFDPGFPR
jgi:cyclopropane fatty-acyl-phospholipid synthase-like methyltransferase